MIRRIPSPNARGEGIRTVRQFNRTTASLEHCIDVMLKQLEKNLDRALEKDRLAGWPEEQANRIRESM